LAGTARGRRLLELNAAVLLWGITALFAKTIPLGAGPITFYRSLAAGLAILVVLVLARRRVRLRRADWPGVAVSGILLALHWVTYFHAIQVSSVAVGVISLHTYPIVTALLEPPLFGRRVRGQDVLLALIVAAGVAILVPGFRLDQAGTTHGVLWGMLSGVLVTLRNLVSRRYVNTYGGTALTMWQVFAGALVLAPLAFVGSGSMTPATGGSLVTLGVLFTALPHAMFTRSLECLSVRTASVIATLLPLYAVAFAALLIGEVPSMRTLVGGAVILGAVAYESLRAIGTADVD